MHDTALHGRSKHFESIIPGLLMDASAFERLISRLTAGLAALPLNSAQARRNPVHQMTPFLHKHLGGRWHDEAAAAHTLLAASHLLQRAAVHPERMACIDDRPAQ